MEDELILLLIECENADKKHKKAEAERIEQMIYIKHSAVKHAAAEHFRYGIKRICFEQIIEYRSLDIELVYLIKNGRQIEEKHTKYLIEIFNIFEKDFKGREDHSDSERENEQNDNRNREEENISRDVRRLCREEIEIDNEAGENGERDRKCYEIGNNI